MPRIRFPASDLEVGSLTGTRHPATGPESGWRIRSVPEAGVTHVVTGHPGPEAGKGFPFAPEAGVRRPGPVAGRGFPLPVAARRVLVLA